MTFSWFIVYIFVLAIIGTITVTFSTYVLQKLLQSSWFLPFKVKLNPREPNRAQYKHEVIAQLKSVFLSILIGYGAVLYIIFYGYSKLYYNFEEYSIWWLILTVPAMVILSDLYLYILHRSLHSKLFYNRIHLVHHRSIRVNVFSSYSLDVIEAVAYTLFLAIFIFFSPTHILNFILFMGLTVVYNFYIHSGWEILPTSNSLVKALNTATMHHLHHIKHDYNFGLYTSLWDRLFGTYLDMQSCKLAQNNKQS